LGPNVPGSSSGQEIDPEELEIVEVSRGNESSGGLGFWGWLTLTVLLFSGLLFAYSQFP